jgi:hypothetical protein
MQFTVPQFIEHEPKIFGPLTFKQFIFIGSAAAIGFILYFTVGKTHLFLSLLASAILLLGALALAFVKVNERSLPTIFLNFINFSVAPKIYLWKRKEMPPRMIKRTEKIMATKEETPTLKFAEKSRLKKLSTHIETRL